jgi:hypothetical protein
LLVYLGKKNNGSEVVMQYYIKNETKPMSANNTIEEYNGKREKDVKIATLREFLKSCERQKGKKTRAQVNLLKSSEELNRAKAQLGLQSISYILD